MQPLTVRTADVAAAPWKNGGGVTRELLALPPGDDWCVRISVADVASDGDFSTFAGALDDGDALAFAGDARTSCRLIDGATRDLNLMLRGTRGALARVVAGDAWRPRERACGLYATAAGSVRADGSAEAPMPAHALHWWTAAPSTIAFDGAGWWLDADAEPPR